jgi:hypothetical protein
MKKQAEDDTKPKPKLGGELDAAKFNASASTDLGSANRIVAVARCGEVRCGEVETSCSDAPKEPDHGN